MAQRPPFPLLLATTFFLGCVAALEGVQWLITSRQATSLNVLSQAEYANMLDHLLPYRLTALVLLLSIGLVTLVVWRARRRVQIST